MLEAVTAVKKQLKAVKAVITVIVVFFC